MTKLRLVVAEDHAIMREGLFSMLESTGLYEIVGQAENDLEAILLAYKELPDLMLVDISMPIRSGLSVIHDLKNTYRKKIRCPVGTRYGRVSAGIIRCRT